MDRQGRQERQEPSAEADAAARVIIDAGLKVHRALGAGLVESTYERRLAHELGLRGGSIGLRVVSEAYR
ncbi:GxxExxY protein [Phenylobacterium sp.]|uniref:GxxExxY protein n=1 Tax=Phenylobacterium sp. TaxID=1871053 RepID=UPI002F3E2628